MSESALEASNSMQKWVIQIYLIRLAFICACPLLSNGSGALFTSDRLALSAKASPMTLFKGKAVVVFRCSLQHVYSCDRWEYFIMYTIKDISCAHPLLLIKCFAYICVVKTFENMMIICYINSRKVMRSKPFY